MYLYKAREHIAKKDKQTLEKKLDNYEERTFKERGLAKELGIACSSSSSSSCEDLAVLGDLKKKENFTTVKKVYYLGSFALSGDENTMRKETHKLLLGKLNKSDKKKAVVLIISVCGVNICDCEGTKIHMTHELKRISYATCNPDMHQFCYLAREPKETYFKQYCHVFMTDTPEEAVDLNAAFRKAFRKAFVKKKKQTPISEILDTQVEDTKRKFMVLMDRERDSLFPMQEEDFEDEKFGPRFKSVCNVMNTGSPPCYYSGMSQQEAVDMLDPSEIGSFVVRNSSKYPGAYTLSVKIPDSKNGGRVAHYLVITTENNGIKLRGGQKEYPTIKTLIKQLTITPDILPCTLRLP